MNKLQTVVEELQLALRGVGNQLDMVTNEFDVGSAGTTHDELIKCAEQLFDIAADCLVITRANTSAKFAREFFAYSAKDLLEYPDTMLSPNVDLIRWHVDGAIGVVSKIFLRTLSKFLAWVVDTKKLQYSIVGGYIPASKKYESHYYGKLMRMGKSCIILIGNKDTDEVMHEQEVAKLCREYVVSMGKRCDINFDINGQQLLIFTHPKANGQVNINTKSFFTNSNNRLL